MPRTPLFAAALFASAAPFASAALCAAAAPSLPQAPFASLAPAVRLSLGKTADWVLPTGDAVWVASTGPFAAHRIDPATNRVIATVPLPGEACAGLAVAAGSLWAPLCGKVPALARIDLATNQLAEVLGPGPAAAEGGIASDGESLWMVTDAKGALVRIDARSGRVTQTVRIPPGSYNPLYSDGVVWVTGHETGEVTAVDAPTGRIVATVPVGAGPRFLTAGGGAVWILLQGTGEVVRIDARTHQVIARIAAGLVGPGGDITFGADAVWPTLFGAPLTRIEARTGRIVRQWTGPGGDSLAWAFGAVWLTDYKAGTIARYPAAALAAPAP